MGLVQNSRCRSQRPSEEFSGWRRAVDELEMTIDRVMQIARPGLVAIVPGGLRHSVKALTNGRAIIVDYPSRPEIVPAAGLHADAHSAAKQKLAG